MARSGRPLSTDQTRLLVALVGALAHRGDAVVLSSLIARLGISEDEARSIIDSLIDLGAISPGFAVAELDGAEGIAIPRTMESHGKVLRLTPSETFAIDCALTRLGMYDDDPLRTKILHALASPAVPEKRYARMAAQLANPDVSRRIMKCSQALFYGTGLRFRYRGGNDAAPRMRRVQPISLSEDEGMWYLEAIDAESGGRRSFRLDRMDAIEEDFDPPIPARASAPSEEPPHEVALTFFSTDMLRLLDWPRIQLQGDPDAPPVRATIPYYGGMWLVRRLAACGSAVAIEDPEIAEAVRAYARTQLA